MKFLYVGKSFNKTKHLQQALKRANIDLERTDTPEHAFFKVLHEEIAALFVDLTGNEIDGDEILSSLESLDQCIEVVLIVKPSQLDHYSFERLRFCYGYITPGVEMACNAMVLNQLTDKLALKGRLEALKNSAIIDGLTQLYNHAYFQQRLEEEISLLGPEREPVALVMFDLDNFKIYNDTNGHPAGDRVLQKVARRLIRTVRKIDLTARYGGEEFVIVLPGASLATALLVTERFRRKIVATDFEFGHLQPLGFVSASFGLAVMDHKTITKKETLIHTADQALYKAKNSGKNCIWYYGDGAYHPYE